MSGVKMSASLEGLRTTIVHEPSSTKIFTVPPVDNGGTGESFSPTDLVAAALAACALSSMALAAKRTGVAWGNASATVEKMMTLSPRRIGELTLHLHMPKELPIAERENFETIARGCPVARSLDSEVKLPMQFHYT